MGGYRSRAWMAWGVALALLLWVAGWSTAQASPAGAEEWVRVRIQAADPQLRAELAARFGVRYDFGPLGFTTTVPASAYRALLERPGVRVSLVPVRTVLGRLEQVTAKPAQRPGSRAVPKDQTPWGIEAIYHNPDLAAVDESAGRGIVVAVLDTGVAKHPDLKAPKECVDFTGPTPKEGSCSDGHGHGTHVTGTILADAGTDNKGIYGVAPGADYFAYKVCNNGGLCAEDDIAAAIRRAADRGARIISMSLGGSTPGDLERQAVQYAWSKGVLVIAAAGNSGPDPDTIQYPGAFPEVVAVAALREDLREVQSNQPPHWTGEPLVVAYFSSRGRDRGDANGNGTPDCAEYLQSWGGGTGSQSAERCLEVAAPGRHVESTYKDGTYATWSGTSMATPHVSGLAARYWAANPGLSNAQVRAWLQQNAAGYDVTLADLTEPDQADPNAKAGYDITAGFGFPQAGR